MPMISAKVTTSLLFYVKGGAKKVLMLRVGQNEPKKMCAQKGSQYVLIRTRFSIRARFSIRFN